MVKVTWLHFTLHILIAHAKSITKKHIANVILDLVNWH